jgi:4-oxalocrotonate tautomerase
VPNITIELFRGRTIEQRRQFVEAVTASAVDILNARRQDVRILFLEIEPDKLANGGVLAIDDASRAEALARHQGTANP